MVLTKQLGFEVEEIYIDELLHSHHNELSNRDLLELERIRVKKHEEAEAEASQAQQQERVLSHKMLLEPISKLSEVLYLIEENYSNVQLYS